MTRDVQWLQLFRDPRFLHRNTKRVLHKGDDFLATTGLMVLRAEDDKSGHDHHFLICQQGRPPERHEHPRGRGRILRLPVPLAQSRGARKARQTGQLVGGRINRPTVLEKREAERLLVSREIVATIDFITF